MRLTRRAVIAGLALSGCAAVSPTRSPLNFAAADGAPVSGLQYGSGEHAVVLVPGAHGVGETWHLQAERLVASGFRVLAMDYRGLGPSSAVPQDSDKAHLDVLGAVRRLRSDGADRVSVIGASWGGAAAAKSSIAAPGLIDRLILLAPSSIDQPESLGGRKLFIVAREDRDGSGRRRVDSIRDQFERAPHPKELLVLEGAAHAQFLFLTAQGERLYSEMLRFLSAR